MTALGRAFRLPPKLISLLSIGASVCGVSAIIAAKGAIEADDEDASYAIAAILALGAVSLVAFPLIGHALGMSDQAYGLWVGLAVDNTAEATAAGALYSDAAGKFAVLAKTARNATIGFVVLGYALYWVRRGGAAAIGDKTALSCGTSFRSSCSASWRLRARDRRRRSRAPQSTDLANLSRWAFLFSFAGIGLRTNLRVAVEPGMAAAHRRRRRRVCDRGADPGPGSRCGTMAGVTDILEDQPCRCGADWFRRIDFESRVS